MSSENTGINEDLSPNLSDFMTEIDVLGTDLDSGFAGFVGAEIPGVEERFVLLVGAVSMDEARFNELLE
jgi:hypothetical protein